MVNKLVSTLGRQAIKRVGNKALEKIVDDYGNLKRKVLNEIIYPKPLNVGERESLDCYKSNPYDVSRCESQGNRARDEYHKTGSYKNR